ncbi:MAG: AbrB/MazE/SpoVT family DNA-binding domain-containing protein [Pseudomonadota bacterium]|nr:AbrB/MazE/SpoVT family DNA-binding domain-containing protein [Pseudomonadota bacterium]
MSIPKAVRAERQWKAGQKFAFIPSRRGVLLVPVPESDELAGIARGAKVEGYRDRDDPQGLGD